MVTSISFCLALSNEEKQRIVKTSTIYSVVLGFVYSVSL